MAVLQTCTPANVYGPLQQTLFLGMSVRDFTASAGWNEQFTTLTVNLVQDQCSGVREYFSEEYTWTSGTFPTGDPGFNYAPVGSPAIFKIGETKDGENIISPGFEFAGLIQSYNVQDSDQGSDLLTVNLIAPGLILEGTQVVVEDFADETEGVRNLINAYGFLESASCVDCPDFPGEGDDDPIQTEDGFGSPAGGFGNASHTSRGTPWIYLKQAIQTLLGGKYTPTDKRFGPDDGVIEYIAGVGTYGSITNNKYILDIEELPGNPNEPGGPTPGGGNDNEAANANSKEYRINGPVVSMLDIISNVCSDGGFDYYVDLLPTKSPGLTIADAGGMVNVIKIRTIARRNTATNEALSGIYDFINSAEITGTVLNSSLGQELVSENTAAFIIGGQRQSMYQVYAYDGYNPLGNTRFWGGNYAIEPFFGYQEPLDDAANNNFNNKKEPIQVLWGEDAPNLSTCPIPPINYYRQWFFYPKLGRLNLIIPAFPDEEELLPCPETMMCAAMGDFESWVNWLFKFGNRSLLYTRYNNYVFETYGTTLPTIRPSAAQLNNPPTDDLTLKYPAANNGNPNEALLKDLKTIYEYLNNLGQNYYGKSFLIEVPFVCYSIDDDTKDIVYSDVPATNGGWVDPPYQDCVQEIVGGPVSCTQKGVPSILGLNHRGQTDAISSDNGTIPAILKYRYDRGIVADVFNGINSNYANYFEATSSNDSYYRPSLQGGIGVNGQDSVNTFPLWVKAEIDADWIFKTKYRNNGGTAACPIFESVVTVNALVTIPEPVYLTPAYDTTRAPLAPFYGISRDNIGILGDNWRLGTYGDVSVFTNPDNGQFINLANNIGNSTEKSAATNVGAFPFAFPCNAVIPIQSNTRTYGPWYRTIDGLNGKVHSEKDDGLVPWEYGGSKFMNLSVDAKISNIIMAQQTNERGSVTVAGYPTKQLGVSLDVNPNYINNGNNAGNGETPTDRVLQNGTYQNDCNSFGYFYIDTNTKDDTNSKAQISDLQVSVAQAGITTTYTLSAFTPIFGRFTKNNAERLKQIGQDKFKRGRDINLAFGKRSVNTGPVSSFFRNFANTVNTTSFNARSSPLLLAGKYYGKNKTIEQADGSNFITPGASVSNVTRKNVLSQNLSSFSQNYDYDNLAYMSWDGLFRPVQNRSSDIDGMPVENVAGTPTSTNNVKQSEVPYGPINQHIGSVINKDYLNFLANPNTALGPSQGTELVGRSDGPQGHDIEFVGRKNKDVMVTGNEGYVSILDPQNTLSYTDDYRYMAHRGPLVLHGWGYDIMGKPIPNSNETGQFTGVAGVLVSGSPFSGNHRIDYHGLTDKFYSGWLGSPETWPTAPVDLRFDRQRGVWTIPSDFRILLVTPQAEIGSNTSGLCNVHNAEDIYDSGGALVTSPTIWVTNPFTTAVPAEKMLAYYAHESGTYYPIHYCCGGSSQPPVCLVGETLIETPYGPTRIDELEVSGAVNTHLGIGTILDIKHSIVEETYEVAFTDGTWIRCTYSHPFAVSGRTEDLSDESQHVQAQFLYEGQVLLGPDGKNKTVRNTNRLLQRKNVYNLTVNNGHTYISNGVYSHNKTPICNACNQSDCLWFCNTSTRVWEIVPGEDCPPDTDADGRSCSCYNPCPDSVCADIADNCPDICSSPDPALNAQCVTAGLCIRDCDDTRPVNCGAGCSDGATPIPYASTDGGDKPYYGGGTTNAIYSTESGTGNYAPVRGQRIANITGEIVIDMSGSNYWSIAYSPTPTTYTGSYDCFTGTCTGGFITSCIGTYQDGCPPDGTGLNARFYPKVINDRYLRLPSGTQVQLQNDGGGLDLYFVTSYKKPRCNTVSGDANLYFYEFVPVDATSSNVVLTLPVSTGYGIDGECYTIKKIDSSSNTVIITGLVNDTIDGQLTYTMYNQNEAVRICNCGDDTWYAV